MLFFNVLNGVFSLSNPHLKNANTLRWMVLATGLFGHGLSCMAMYGGNVVRRDLRNVTSLTYRLQVTVVGILRDFPVLTVVVSSLL